ncbi:hypothetical protein P2R12_24820 [Cytobacillus oceanisediminis]|nr:hypothetical protein [Cytobacillus oceanisediminis]MDF2040173.1 hypothetical protein [Cytobacillus oceanisediminis]
MVILIMEMNGCIPFFNMAAHCRVSEDEIQTALYVQLTEIGMKFIT